MAKAKAKAKKKVKAYLLLKLFDGDTVKENEMRSEMRGKSMVRKKKDGTVIVDNQFSNNGHDKGKPPKKDKKKER